MFNKFARKFSNWKAEEKKLEKEQIVEDFEDLSGNWYESAGSVFVSERELERELFNPNDRSINSEKNEGTKHNH